MVGRKFLIVPAALLAWFAPPASAADEPRVFVPSGEWSVSSDGESCVLVRQFGGSKGITLGLQAFSPNATSYNAIMRGDPLPQRDPGAVEIGFRFSPDREPISGIGILGAGDTPRLTFPVSFEPESVLEARRNGEATLPMSNRAREAAIDAFVISFSRGRPLQLELDSMAAPLDQLRECAADLPEKWGLDPEVQRSLSRPPTPIDIGSWLRPGSYPWEYLRNGMSVRVYLRVMTDALGGVVRCAPQYPRGDSIAGTVACREVTRAARFEPALDTNGDPVPGYFTTSIFFHTGRSNGPLAGENNRHTLCC